MPTPRTTGKLVWNTMVSLDGFVADRDDAMDWAFGFDLGSGASSAAMVERLGALLVGRRTMDVEDRNRPGFYAGAFTGPFFVLSSDRGRPAPVVKGVTGTLVHDSVDVAVEQALRAADGKDVGLLGPTLARSCLDLDLVDEIVVFVVPLLLGSGVRFYEGAPRRLDLVRAEPDGEVTTLTVVPRRTTLRALRRNAL